SVVTLLLFSTYIVTSGSSITPSHKRWLMWSILAACLSFILPHVVLGTTREWYWTAPLLSVFYVTLEVDGEREMRRLGLIKVYCLALCVVVGIDIVTVSQRYRGGRQHTRYLVDYVNRVVPSSEKIYQEDLSGFVGFWSRPHVINGDGVANSYEYLGR